jgi:CDP-6-deoxy-D-xylo-4-hexulose-3-dehydrase
MSLEKYFIPHEPTKNSEPSWFGYAITIRDDAPFKRTELINYLTEKRIDTRLLFGGNLIKQPAYVNKQYLVSGSLNNSDIVMNNTFWIGVYPGINNDMIEYVKEVFSDFLKNYS